MAASPNYQTQASSSSDATTYNFTSLTIAAGQVVIGVHGLASSSPNTELDGGGGSATVDGNAMTFAVSRVSAFAVAAIAHYAGFAGGTVTVSVTFGESQTEAGVGVWSVSGNDPTPTDTDENGGGGSTISLTGLTVPTDGCGIAVICNRTSGAGTWTGATERFDVSPESGRHSGADTTTAGTNTITADFDNVVAQAIVGIAFGPFVPVPGSLWPMPSVPKRITQQSEAVFGPYLVDDQRTTPVAGWAQPFRDPTLPITRRYGDIWFGYPPIVQAESIFPGHWYQAWREPVRRPPTPNGATFDPVAAAGKQLDGWYREWLPPVRRPPRPNGSFDYVNTLTPSTGWYVALSEPTRWRGLLPASQQVPSLRPPWPDINVSWYVQLSEPRRSRLSVPVAAMPYHFAQPYPYISIGWYVQLSEPKRFPRALDVSNQTYRSELHPNPVITIGWYMPLSEPKRLPRGFANYELPTFFWDSIQILPRSIRKPLHTRGVRQFPNTYWKGRP